MEENKVLEEKQIETQEESINQPTPQTNAEERSKKKGRFLVLWILTGIFFAISLAITLYFLINIGITMNSGSKGAGLGVAILIVVMIALNAIPCSATAILSIIGLLLTIFKRPNGLRVGQLIYFIVLTVLPVLMFFSFSVIV